MPPNKEAALGGSGLQSNRRKKRYQKLRHRQANSATVKPDFRRSSQAALHHLPRLLTALGLSFREEGNEIVMLNPHRADAHYGSFRINRRTGRWADFALHEARGSDAVSLVAYVLQIRQGEAARWVQQRLGVRHEQ